MEPWLSAENVTIEQRLAEMVSRADLDQDTQDVITHILRSPRLLVLQEQVPAEDQDVITLSWEEFREEVDG